MAGISGDEFSELSCLPATDCTFISFNRDELNFIIPGMSDVMPYPSSRFSTLSEQHLDSYSNTFRKTVTKVAEEFSPDVIHSHHLWLASIAARTACPDIPMVCSCHSTDLRQYLHHEHLRHRISAITQLDRILALSQTQRDQIIDVHGINNEKIDIVGGGYDTKRFIGREKMSAPPVQFVYAGKLSSAKGVPSLLQAIERLSDPRIHLHLVGSGSSEEGEYCLQLAQYLPNSVTIHGAITQEKLADLMGKCHVFVLPSFFEGLPLVLLEALSSGCRIICSDLPGCKELLERGGPDIVDFVELPKMIGVDQPDPSDIDTFTSDIARALAKMTDRVIDKPSPSASDIKELTRSYSWDAVFSRVEEIYKEVTGSA